MRSRSFLSAGLACAMALGCAATLPHYEQSRDLTVAGNDPYGPGGTEGQILLALEARQYALQRLWEPDFQWYTMSVGGAWGVRLTDDGWDQIEVRWRRGDAAGAAVPPTSYRWFLRARSFGADGAEQPARVQARADVDGVLAAVRTTVATGAAGDTSPPTPGWNMRPPGPSACWGGSGVGAFTGLPPWAGAPPEGANAGRIVQALEADGWNVTEPFPSASLGMLVAQRARPEGTEALTVLAIRPVDRTFHDVRVWYEVRVVSCDSAGDRRPPDAATAVAAERVVTRLHAVVAGASADAPAGPERRAGF